MTEFIESVAELRRTVPAPSAKTPLKKLATLETHSARFVDQCGLAVFVTRHANGRLELALRAGAGRCVRRLDDRNLLVSDDADLGSGQLAEGVLATGVVGGLLAIPGIRETVRVNGRGRIATTEERVLLDPSPHAAIVLEIDETYLHCPKAFLRSSLWEKRITPSAEPSAPGEARVALGAEERAFLALSPFALIGTCGPDGAADVSPRGDPAGFVHVLEDDVVLLPERPGNRLLDNLENIVQQPEMAVACLVPGVARVLRLQGRARLTTEEALLAPLAVRGRVPHIGIRIELSGCSLEDAPGFDRGALWDPSTYVERDTLPTFGRMLIDQLDPTGRLKAVKAAALQALLKRDEKHGLY